MSKPLHLVISILLLLLPISITAGETRVWTADDLPMPHLQNARTWVCNPDNVLTQETTDSIDAIINRQYEKNGTETVVIVVKQLQGGSSYDFGMSIGRKYKIGSKKNNNGLIIVLSTEDRDFYILTGRGMEATLPDAICKRVQNRYANPLLKQGEWNAAILQTVKALDAYIGKEAPSKEDEPQSEVNGVAILGMLFFFIVLGLAHLTSKRKKKCPHCGKRNLAPKSQKFMYTKGSTDYFRVTYICENCQYTETKIERRPHRDHSSGSGPFVIGSGFLGGSGRMGGGGFSGGSFGGGSFGGGGAGGRF